MKAGAFEKKDKHKELTALEEAKGLGTLLALEPRIMFDGAAIITGAEVVQNQVTQDQDLQGINANVEAEAFSDPLTDSIDLFSALSSVATPSDRNEIVFIDTSVDDYQTLMDGIDPNAEVVLLDSTRDGIEQIAEILGERTDIDAIHIVSHGDQGELRLGTGVLNLASMQSEYADELAIINQALTEEADFLIYGCNFGEGEAGQEASTLLAELTGADIAASDNLTGSTELGGDWELEVNVGTIETSVAFSAQAQQNWHGLLVPLVDTGEFTVNDASGNDEETSGLARGSDRAVDIASNGDYVVVWTDETTSNSVHAKVFDKDGNEKVAEFQVNIGVGNNQWANVAMDDSGNFVVTWTQSSEVFMRRFQADGTAIDAGDVQVNTLTTNFQQNPSVSMNGGGDFVIAWETAVGVDAGIYVRQGTFAGGLIGSDITVDAGSGRANASVDINDAGKFVVVWQQGNEPHAQRFAADGTPRGSAIDINPLISSLEQHPVVAVQSSGDFVVAYRSEVGGFQGVWMKRYQDDGTAYGLATKVSSGTSHVAPSIDMDSSGNYTIVYEGDGDGSGKGVFGRSYDSGGTAQGAEFQINQTTLNAQDRASVAMSELNNFVVVWTGSDGAQTDVFARQFGTANTPPTADAGGPYVIDEGDSLIVNASASSDPDPDTLTYTWDLDGDGLFDDASGVNPTITWATLNAMTNPINDDGSYTVTVRVDDGNGGVTTDSASLTVNNVAPTLTTTGAATIVSGSSYTLNLSASDPGNDTISGWTINWGDGTIDIVAGNPPSVTHTYTNSGLTFNILASATDEDGTFLQNELLVPRYTADSVFRFEETTGAFLQQFAPQSGGLDDPIQTIIGPDGNLYVTGERSDNVVRYNPITGTKIDEFVTGGSGGLNSSGGLAFGPDGNLYVASYQNNRVLRFDGTTGAFIDTFATGVTRAYGVEFGPDGNLYVSSFTGNTVLKFDGTTGASLGTFVTANAGGLSTPERMTFGPDGHLYIASSGSDEVLRYNGTTGAFINAFVTAGLGGLDSPGGIDFGPDGNLYVGSQTNDNVLRYDGTTGAFIGEYVSSATGLDRPALFTFLPGHQVLVTNALPTLDLDANDSSGATGNDYQFTFTEGDGPTAIADMDTDLVDVDSTTFASVKLAVSGLLDGNAETLILDGDTFALATAVAGQDTTGGNYRVAIATGAGTATISITKQGGGTFTEIETETLVEAIQYQHTDTSAPTDGDRLIDFTVNDGIADSAAARTTINVNPTNDDPVITSDGGGPTAAINAAENQTSVTTVTVTDVDLPADTLTFSKIGGADAALFNIDSGTGALTFSGARDFETFTDANSDGVYEVTVQVDDGNGGMDTQAISVTVTDVVEGNTLVVDTTVDYGSADARYGDTSSIGALLVDKGSDNLISLREAIEAANNTANGGTADEIHFNIADNDPGHFYYRDDSTGGLLSSVATTTVSDAMIGDFDPDYPYAQHSWFRIDLNNALPQLDITDAVIINGYTQAGATQNTLSIGDNAELRIELTSSGADGNRGLTIQTGGAGSSISGLAINGFDLAGILTEPGADNVTVQGNFIGTDVTGTIDLGNGDAGVQLRSSGNQIGGSNVADRNVISGNQARGVSTFTFGPIATGNVIQNNYIGADATGIGDLGNSGLAGVQIYNQDGLQLLNNVIGDNANDGVRLLNSDSIVNTVIQGNLIGVGADGTTDLRHSGGHGIFIDEATVNTTIGGILPGQGNTIANNAGDGIAISDGTGTSIRGNSIFDNNQLGIDLLNDNVTNNDAGDGDSGPNNLQNFPLLTTAKTDGTDLTVNGTLNSTAGTTFNIDFYASTTADGTGHGQAERYLGSASVTTDGSGNATISQLLSGVGVALGEFVTATATDSNGNTSEFSLNVVATSANIAPVAMPDGFTVNEGSTTTLNLASNDTDADDGLDLTSISIISGPTNGTITSINMNGTVDYTHNGSETLADSFTYTINDLSGATSNTVTVSLTVTPQNDAPVITSDGGGANASISILTGNTAVTAVNASDAEGSPLTYSIAGGADAALFNIDPTTGALTFNTAPNFQAPGDVGNDNVYDVIVRASDGTASDTQAIAVTVTDVPVVVLPPPPDPPSESDSPSEDEGDTGESEEEASGNVVNTATSSHGSVSTGSEGSAAKDPKGSNLTENRGENDLAAMQQQAERQGMVSAVSDLLNLLQKTYDSATFQTEMQSLLSKSGFLQDLDRVRDTFQGAADTEKIYLASSIAASSGLSIGYVIWLLRSGVLLTALLSSVPAWQFVNPLLILDAPTQSTPGKGPEDLEDDSVEAMFENHTVPEGASETQTEGKDTTDTSPWTRDTSR